jgi:hypothetical protein
VAVGGDFAERFAEQERRLRSPRLYRWLLAPVLGVIVGVVAVLGTSEAAPVSRASQAKLPVAQLVALARDSLRELDDPNVKTASVVATTKNAAENWIEPGAVPPSHPDPKAYLIVLQGRFICESCSFLGPNPPRGRSSQFVWIPGYGAPDGGLTHKVPPALGKLGRVVKLPLIAPRGPAAELMLQPAVGIGPVRLGVRRQELARRIGPALQAGRWVFGPIEVFTQSARDGRVDRLAVVSPQATIDRHTLGEGYMSLSNELGRWRSLDCGNESGCSCSMVLEFADGKFELAWIGIVPPVPVWARSRPANSLS